MECQEQKDRRAGGKGPGMDLMLLQDLGTKKW